MGRASGSVAVRMAPSLISLTKKFGISIRFQGNNAGILWEFKTRYA